MVTNSILSRKELSAFIADVAVRVIAVTLWYSHHF